MTIGRVLTDRGTEYCGAPERHEYEPYLAVENLDPTRTKVKSRQSTGIGGRFHKTVLDEFHRLAFRKRIYSTINQLPADLDAWKREYHEVRTYQGRWCFGRTPMQTFLDTAPIAREKIIRGHMTSDTINLPDTRRGGSGCQVKSIRLHIAAWGAAHLPFLRRHLPYAHGVPGERWLTILMNRIDPALFSAAFTAWVRATFPGRADFVAIDGKTSRRGHDRRAGSEPIHLVSAFATTSRLVLAQEAVPDKANELAAIPVRLDRLGGNGGLAGALVSIDAIATNPTIAAAIRGQGADYLLAVKANQPTLRAELEAAFAVGDGAGHHHDLDKGHGRVEERHVSVIREVDWLAGTRRFPGEMRLPDVAAIVRVHTTAHIGDRTRTDTRSFISSAPLTAERAADAVRGHWGIENRLHWVLDVLFKDDLARLRTGHGAKNMAVVRHFALNLIRAANDRKSLKTRRKMAGWSDDHLDSLLNPATP